MPNRKKEIEPIIDALVSTGGNVEDAAALTDVDGGLLRKTIQEVELDVEEIAHVREILRRGTNSDGVIIGESQVLH